MSMVDEQPRATAVKEVLNSILESHHFKTSKQCQDLLRYIVHRSLKSDDASLRERIIGIEVFGRQPNYDTSEDPVVRVRAADVRKRLAQYYQSLPPGTPALHIDLQPGCYRVHFRVDPPTDQPAFPTGTRLVEPASTLPDLHAGEAPGVEVDKVGPHSKWWSRKLPAAAFLLLAIVGISAWIVFDLPTPQQRFWAPVSANKQPVLFYVGSNAAYALSAEFLAKYRAEHGIPNSGPEIYVDFPPNSTVQASDLIAVHDTFVTTGDLAAAVQLATLMTAWKRPFILRSGRDLSFGDLRNRPSVMIGAFNNPWTLEFTDDLPFAFRQGDRIQSRDHPEKDWIVKYDSNARTTDDYALISRLLSSKSGGPLITVAGIGEFGTQAAGEFLANPEKIQDMVKTAPSGWEKKNMQAVLHIKVVGYAPVAVEVVATSYW